MAFPAPPCNLQMQVMPPRRGIEIRSGSTLAISAKGIATS